MAEPRMICFQDYVCSPMPMYMYMGLSTAVTYMYMHVHIKFSSLLTAVTIECRTVDRDV